MELENILQQVWLIQEGRRQMQAEIQMWRKRFADAVGNVSPEVESKFMQAYAGMVVQNTPETVLQFFVNSENAPEAQESNNSSAEGDSTNQSQKFDLNAD